MNLETVSTQLRERNGTNVGDLTSWKPLRIVLMRRWDCTRLDCTERPCSTRYRKYGGVNDGRCCKAGADLFRFFANQTAVPEPSTLFLIDSALVGSWARRVMAGADAGWKNRQLPTRGDSFSVGHFGRFRGASRDGETSPRARLSGRCAADTSHDIASGSCESGSGSGAQAAASVARRARTRSTSLVNPRSCSGSSFK